MYIQMLPKDKWWRNISERKVKYEVFIRSETIKRCDLITCRNSPWDL